MIRKVSCPPFQKPLRAIPNPSQIARGVQLLNDDDGNYANFSFFKILPSKIK